jgi:nitrogen fixation NifU-like protein
MSAELNELYQQVIIDHSRHPRNFRKMEDANREARGNNPLCGDKITVYLKMHGDVVQDVSFQGDGCAISLASASMMTEALKGKTKADVEKMFGEVHDVVAKGTPPNFDELGKLGALAGVNKFPMRVKCAILAWHAVSAAVAGGADVVSTETEDGQKLS